MARPTDHFRRARTIASYSLEASGNNMIDPFAAWSRMIAAGFDMQSTWLRGFETVQASLTVISARTDKMRDAVRSPMRADTDEFARMVPEKVGAFSESARRVARESKVIQDAWIAQTRRVCMMTMRGRLPTVLEAATLGSQTLVYSMGAMIAGARLGEVALAPIHRTVAANARRLGREQTK